MKFKVGDKVKHKDFGFGKIVYINEKLEELGENRYAVQFETFNKNLHDLGICGAPEVKMGHGWWCEEGDLELDAQQSRNLIPQIAKMLGVEIGEEFMLINPSDKNDTHECKFRSTENCLEYKGGIYNYDWKEDKIALISLIKGTLIVQKLPQTPKLTEAERVILEELFKKYTKIIRIETTELWVYNNSKDWKGLAALSHLFQFIGEYRKEYDIEELLRGEK